MNETNAIVLVGYTTKARPDAATMMPEFTAPSNYKPETAAAYVSNKQQEWLAESSRNSPYTGTLASCRLAAMPPRGLTGDIRVSKEYDAGEISRFLFGPLGYQAEFSSDGSCKAGPIRFIGFDVRTFVKLAALEATEKGSPWPQSMWFGTAEHRDIENAVCPDKTVSTLRQAVSRLLIHEHPDLASYTGPGIDADRDIALTALLTAKLNLFPWYNKQLLEVAYSFLEKPAIQVRPRVTEPILQGKKKSVAAK